VHAAGDEARKVGLPLIVHATGLWEAKDALRAGARVLVHSVWSAPVDDEFLTLARSAGAVYVPTLIVPDGYAQVSARRFVPTARRWRASIPLRAPSVRHRHSGARATPTRVAATTGRRIARSLVPGLARNRRREQGAANLKRVFDAGIPVALGTDAGNPLTLHGASVFQELEAMQASGLAPRDVRCRHRERGSCPRARQYGTVPRAPQPTWSCWTPIHSATSATSAESHWCTPG